MKKHFSYETEIKIIGNLVLSSKKSVYNKYFTFVHTNYYRELSV